MAKRKKPARRKRPGRRKRPVRRTLARRKKRKSNVRLVGFAMIAIFLGLVMVGRYVGSDFSQDRHYVDLGDFCGESTLDACETDSDCIPEGCSGQVCAGADKEPFATTCEWKECYDDEKYGASCLCIDNQCQWWK